MEGRRSARPGRRSESGDSEAKLRRLLDNVPVGLYRTTPAGRLEYANPALVGILGYPDPQSLQAANTTDLYADPGDRRAWQALVEREGIAHDFQVRLRRFDGTEFWGSNSAGAVTDDRGRGA